MRTKAIRKTRVFSHNDEMQGAEKALFWALSVGCGAIEVDTWLASDMAGNKAAPSESDTLLIGHDEWDLNIEKTLQKVYLDPLIGILERNNPGGVEKEGWVGLYKDDPTAEVMIAIDMKTDGDKIFDALDTIVKPLLAKNYLTTYDTTTKTWRKGPIMVVGTGSTPLKRVADQSFRYIFLDAQLHGLDKIGDEEGISVDGTIAPIASTRFPVGWKLGESGKEISEEEMIKYMQAESDFAESRGVKARYWGAPRYAESARRKGWELQYKAGVHWMTADDLEEATEWLAEQK